MFRIETPLGVYSMSFVTSRIDDPVVQEQLHAWEKLHKPLMWSIYQNSNFRNVIILGKDVDTHQIVLGIAHIQDASPYGLAAWIHLEPPQQKAKILYLTAPFCQAQNTCAVKDAFHTCIVTDDYKNLYQWIETILKTHFHDQPKNKKTAGP